MTGNTESVEAVDILARVEGFLEKVHFVDGQDVKKGDVLFTIEQDVFKANVEQAEALLKSSIAERERAEEELRKQQKALVSLALHSAFIAGDVDRYVLALNEIVAEAMDVARVSVWFLELEDQELCCHDLYLRQEDTHHCRRF